MDVTAVREYIVDTFLFGEASELQGNTSLLDTGIIDSTGVLELVSFLENTYDLTVEDDELLPENLDSLDAISAYVGRKKNHGAPDASAPTP